jgi:hypothetical protein
VANPVDVRAQRGLICAPRLMIAEESSLAQIAAFVENPLFWCVWCVSGASRLPQAGAVSRA